MPVRARKEAAAGAADGGEKAVAVAGAKEVADGVKVAAGAAETRPSRGPSRVGSRHLERILRGMTLAFLPPGLLCRLSP